MLLRIAQITDLHLDEDFPFKNHSASRERFDRVLYDIRRKRISHVVCTGDIGENNGINYFFDQLRQTTLSITLGNHDHFAEISKHYPNGADHESQKLYSSTLLHHHRVIYLDSSEGVIDKKQLQWLKKEMTLEQPVIIFIHHPILGLPFKVDEIGKLKNRKEVLAILKQSSNEIGIYCGHYHLESTLVYENITQYITPAVSFQIEKSLSAIEIDTAISGYRIIEIGIKHHSSQVQLLRNAD